MWSKIRHFFQRLRWGGTSEAASEAASESLSTGQLLQACIQQALRDGKQEVSVPFEPDELPVSGKHVTVGRCSGEEIVVTAHRHNPQETYRKLAASPLFHARNDLGAVPEEFHGDTVKELLYKQFFSEMADRKRAELYQTGGMPAVREEVKRLTLAYLENANTPGVWARLSRLLSA